MARRLTLRTVSVEGPAGNLQEFDYAEMMMLILRGGAGGQQGRGLTIDEVLKSLETIEPIERAVREKADTVTLSDTQWATLKEKLDQFQFGFAHRAIADFGLMVRNAPEIGTEPEKQPRLVS